MQQQQLLTASSLDTFRTCHYRYWLAYVLGLRKIIIDKALRIGTVIDTAINYRGWNHDCESATKAALAGYETVPEWADARSWAAEAAVCRELIAAYYWRYSEDAARVESVQPVLYAPLINPKTKYPSQKFRLGMKLDGLWAWQGQTVLSERKTTKSDISPDSDYWLRLRCDPQLLMYVLGLHANGHGSITTAIYDVIRKPGIEPYSATPEDKRKYRKDGALYANQHDTDEAVDEYAARVRADIQENPDKYFARREVPILSDELARFREQLWQQAQHIIWCAKRGAWYCNVSWRTCNYCPYASFCLNGIRPQQGEAPPNGYEIVENVHPELTTGDMDNE